MSLKGRERHQREVSSGSYRSDTERALILGGFGVILLVGGALMLLTMGTAPAAIGIGLIVLLAGVMLALYAGLALLERVLKRG